ncbi:MAG: PH domain-containing protein [Patescibacteria group bacterium]
MYFPGIEKDEKIILLVRRHFFAVILHIILSIVYFLIPPVVLFLALTFLITGFEELPYFSLIILGITIYYLIWWLLFFKDIFDWYLDAWIITDRRLLDVEQRGFFHHTVSELRLDKVQDVTVEIKGFFPSIFHFGNIYAQTAAAVQRFTLEDIPNPERVRNIVLEAQEKAGQKTVIYQGSLPQKPQ